MNVTVLPLFEIEEIDFIIPAGEFDLKQTYIIQIVISNNENFSDDKLR